MEVPVTPLPCGDRGKDAVTVRGNAIDSHYDLPWKDKSREGGPGRNPVNYRTSLLILINANPKFARGHSHNALAWASSIGHGLTLLSRRLSAAAGEAIRHRHLSPGGLRRRGAARERLRRRLLRRPPLGAARERLRHRLLRRPPLGAARERRPLVLLGLPELLDGLFGKKFLLFQRVDSRVLLRRRKTAPAGVLGDVLLEDFPDGFASLKSRVDRIGSLLGGILHG